MCTDREGWKCYSMSFDWSSLFPQLLKQMIFSEEKVSGEKEQESERIWGLLS